MEKLEKREAHVNPWPVGMERPIIRVPGRRYTDWVYLIGADGVSRVKIGKSDDPKKRLSGMQTGSPVRLVLLALIDCGKDASGTEQMLHEKFRDNHTGGEWFDATPEIIQYFNRFDQDGLLNGKRLPFGEVPVPISTRRKGRQEDWR